MVLLMNEKQLPTQLTDTTDIVLVAVVVVVVVAFPNQLRHRKNNQTFIQRQLIKTYRVLRHDAVV